MSLLQESKKHFSLSRYNMWRKLRFFAGICFFVIFGCALYQKPVIQSLNSPEQFKYMCDVKPYHLDNDWWKIFDDKYLNQLVETAIKNNQGYQVAIKNIEVSKTYVTQYESNRFPQVNLNGNVSRNKFMNLFNPNFFTTSTNPVFSNTMGAGFPVQGTFNLIQLYGSVSYELDVWNQIGNTVNQAKAGVAISEAQSNVIKLTLISNVVNTYFQIAATNMILDNLKLQYQINNRLFPLTHTQYRGKLIDKSTVYTAKNQVEAVSILIQTYEKQRETLINSLAYLLGEYPEKFKFYNASSLNNIQYSKLIPSGISSEIIANRPDVQQAYFQLMSDGYVKKQMIANFLPTFNFTGNYGYANTSFSQFLSPQNSFWNYGLSLLQPVYDYQLRKSEYLRAKYQFESDYLNYKSTVINAFQEVDNALISYQKDMKALLFYQQEEENLKRIVRIGEAQYQAGYAAYSTYLSDKLSLVQIEFSIINQQLMVMQDIIQIYKTFGLGVWP